MKWVDQKVCWKFNDPPRYIVRLVLKNSVSVFSVHAFSAKQTVECL